MKNILSILLLLLAFTACKDPKAVTDVLNRAEAVMNEHPDSALNLLRTLTFDDFQKEENRARYALLHSQALDKNYIDVTGDSLISVAVEYYKDKDDVRSKFLSYYYMGRVHANGERYLQATSCLMESEQLVEEVGDDYLSGLLYSEMGRIYEIYYDFSKSLEAHQKAAECYERAGKIHHRNYMWLNQSLNYRNLRKYDECEHLLRMTLESALKEDDSELLKSCLGDLIMLYVNQSRLVEAKELYEKLKGLADFRYDSSSFMGKLAKMYALEGNLSQAMELLVQGWKQAENKTDSANLFIAAAEVYSLQGKGEAAYRELLKGVVCQNEDAHQVLRQPVLTAQRDYLSDKLEFEAYKLQMERHLRVLYILFFLVLLAFVVYVLFRKLKKEKEKARRTIDELNGEMQRKEAESHRKVTSLLQELERKSQSEVVIDSLKAELRQWDEHFRQYIKEVDKAQEQQRIREKELIGLSGKLLASRTKQINVLLDCIYTDADNKDVVYQRLTLFSEQLMKELGSGKKAYVDLEQIVDKCYDGMMRRIRSEVQLPDEESYRQVCYHLAGFSVKSIALLMG
ncbi:MAG: hypothetical protein IKW43_06140, partial [Bacteroidaceae bacterium]|nr:hypothetical protein [Bacteroidaceae bacterium]